MQVETSQSDGVPRPRPARWRRWLAWLALAALLGLGVLGLVYGLRNELVAPLVVDWLQRSLERRTGLLLSIDQVGGDWLDDLTLSGVSVHARESGRGLRRAVAREVEVAFDLRRLLAGDLAGLTRVDLRDVALELDLDAPARAATGGAAGTFELPERLPSGSITGLSLVLDLEGERRIELEHTGLLVGPQGGGNRVALDVARATWDVHDARTPVTVRLHSELAYHAGVLDVRELTLDGDLALRARETELDLRRVARGELGWTAALDAFDGHVRSRGRLQGAELESELALEDVDLAAAWRAIAPGAHEVPSARVDLDLELVVAGGRPFGSARLELRRGCLAGRSIDLLRADLSYADAELDLARIEVLQGPNSLSGEHLAIPFDRPGWLETLRASRGRFELDVTDVAALTGAVPARMPVHHLRIAGALASTGVELSSGRLVTPGGELAVERGRIEWGTDAAELLRTTHFDLETSANFHDLSPLAELFGSAAWSGRAHGALRFEGTLDAPSGRFDLVGDDVVAAGVTLGDLHALARVDRERLHVESLSVDGPYGQGEIRGDLLLAARAIDHAQWSLASERLGELVPERFERGAFQAQGELAGSLQAPLGTFVLVARDLVVRCGPTLPELAVLGGFDGERVRCDELALSIERARVRASGAAGYRDPRWPIHLERADVVREGLDLALVAPLDFALGAGRLDLDRVALAGSAGRIVGSLAWHADGLAVSARCDELDPMPLLAPLVPGGFALTRAHGSFELQVSPAHLEASADFGLDGLRVAAGAPDCSLAFRGRYQPGVLSVEALELQASDGSSLVCSGSVPLDLQAEHALVPGDLDLDLRASVDELASWPWSRYAPQRRLHGRLQAQIALSGAWRALRGNALATGRGLHVAPLDAHPAAVESMLVPADCELRATLAQGLEIESFELTAPGQLELDAVGRAGLECDLVAYLERGTGALAQAPIELHATLAAADLGFVAGLAPQWLRRTAGRLDGELELRGSAEHPDLRGSLRLEGGELRTSGKLPTIDRLSGAVRFEGARVTVEELQGEIGAGSLVVGGALDFAGSEPELALDLGGRDILLVQERDLRARANAALHVAGPWSKLRMSGEVDLTDGRYTERIEWLEWFDPRGKPPAPVRPSARWFSIQTEPLADMSFDVALSATRAFRIDNNLARAALRPDLRLRGTGREPEIVGSIYADSARLSLLGSSLDLVAGRLEMTALEPRRPQLDLSFATRVAGYDVTVQMRGRSDAPEIEYASNPPLAREAILQLLATGEAPTDASLSETGLETAQVVAVYLGKDLMTRWFGSSSGGDEESFFERIEWKRGADVTETGGSTYQAKLRLSGPMQGPGRAVYLAGERDRYDRINFGLRFVLRLK